MQKCTSNTHPAITYLPSFVRKCARILSDMTAQTEQNWTAKDLLTFGDTQLAQLLRPCDDGQRSLMLPVCDGLEGLSDDQKDELATKLQ